MSAIVSACCDLVGLRGPVNNQLEKGWKARGIWIWLLTILACLLVLIVLVLAYCMAVPIRFDGLGGFAATYALLYPLHVLLFTVLAASMAYIASRSRAWLSGFFGFVAITTLIMGLIAVRSVETVPQSYR